MRREKMKTRAKSFLKGLTMAALVSTLFISCGKKNSSGGSSNSPSSGGITSSHFSNNQLSTIANEYSCGGYDVVSNNRTSIPVDIQGPITGLNNGAVHVGVSASGDILIIANTNGQIRAEVHACERLLPQQRAQFIIEPIVNSSAHCSIAEITKADVLTGTSQPDYHLPFFPIDVAKPSSLCNY